MFLGFMVVREKSAVAVNLGLDRLRAVDGAGQFRTTEGDDGEPAEDDEGDQCFHVREAINLAPPLSP